MIMTTENRPVSDLYAEMITEDMREIKKGAELDRIAMTLIECLGRKITDEEQAAFDEISDQSFQNVNRPDIYMWTLEQYVRALGGEVVIKLEDQAYRLAY